MFLGPKGKCAKIYRDLAHHFNLEVSDIGISMSSMVAQPLLRFLNSSVKNVQGRGHHPSPYAFSVSPDLFAEEWTMLENELSYPKHTNVIVDRIQDGAHFLITKDGESELAFETEQRDIHLLSAKFRLESTSYQWMAYNTAQE